MLWAAPLFNFWQPHTIHALAELDRPCGWPSGSPSGRGFFSHAPWPPPLPVFLSPYLAAAEHLNYILGKYRESMLIPYWWRYFLRAGKITLCKTAAWFARPVTSCWGLLEVEPGVKYPTDLLSAPINHLPHIGNSSAIALCPLSFLICPARSYSHTTWTQRKPYSRGGTYRSAGSACGNQRACC